MRIHQWGRVGLVCAVSAALVTAQQQAPPILVLPPSQNPITAPAPAPTRAPAAAPPAGQAKTAPAQAPAAAPAQVAQPGVYQLNNVSLIDFLNIVAKELKINYILDPRVKGAVTINTYGEVRPTDLMPLLQTVLRINGAAMVKVGDLYRVVPLQGVVKQLPIPPTINGKDLPNDERMVLNLVFLKFTTADEMAKLLTPFLGEGGEISTYPPANLLMIQDNSRNMRRTMDLLAMFDSDTFAGQRVRLFETSHGRPSDIAKELDAVFKAYALSDKTASARFLPVDRINTLIAVAANPGIFAEVDKWLKKLDVQPKVPAGAVNNYVYRLKYGRAETVSMAIMALYTGNIYALMAMGAMVNSAASIGGGGVGTGGMYNGGVGGMGGYGMGAMGMGGMGMYGMGMGMGYPGGYGGGAYGGGYGYGGYGNPNPAYTIPAPGTTPATPTGTAGTSSLGSGTDLTGSYLGYGAQPQQQHQRIPHVIPNPFDNTLLVQGTPQEWEQISNLLEQLDVPPRQVLVEARIYEVDLTGAFSSGVAAYLNARDNNNVGGSTNVVRSLLGSAGGNGLTLTGGLLVGRSRQLLGILTAQETADRAKVISEPSVIATDSIPATINVGQEVPTLASQAVSGAQVGGNSLFANTVNNRNSGVTLQITARVNSSGIVTMVIDQEVSKPEPPPANAAIQSPSFSKRNVQTQVTVQDGDTIAIGGIIQETETLSSAGIPVLHRIPIIGGAFGNKSLTKARTELIVFLTPRVIYDTNQIVEATDELSGRLKKLKKMIRE